MYDFQGRLRSDLNAHSGSFLIAKFQLEFITECTRVGDVFAYLESVPSGLNTFYDQTWNRFASDNGSPASQRARLILMWVTLAEEPLSVRALGEAISVPIDGVVESLPTEEEIVGACPGLVHSKTERVSQPFSQSGRSSGSWLEDVGDHPIGLASDLEDRCIVFVHASAHQYFLSKASSYFPQAHDSIVAKCLSLSDPVAVTWAVRFQTSYIATIL